MRNVLAVHDISCVGRCSLTVAQPIISAFGVSCAVLPTALLSTHTGGFSEFTCLDLTDEMNRIIDAWKPHSLAFDVIYTGYLAHSRQVAVVERLFREYSALKVVDPVMGDEGRLYAGFDDCFVSEMRRLVAVSDVLVPNVTEALFLVGEPYVEPPYSEEFVCSLINRLHGMGAKIVVLTGVCFEEDRLGVAVSLGDGVEYYFRERILGYYHGTGDVFGSVLSACLARGEDVFESACRAVDFVVDSIFATPKEQDKRFGVDFESVLARRL